MYVFCKLLILFTLLYSYNSFANSCEGGFSPVQRGETASFAEEAKLIQNAKKKLKQDLKEIRRSPQEPILKAQGFKPSYYEGVDLVREINLFKKYWENYIEEDSPLVVRQQVNLIIAELTLTQNSKVRKEKLKLLEDLILR